MIKEEKAQELGNIFREFKTKKLAKYFCLTFVVVAILESGRIALADYADLEKNRIDRISNEEGQGMAAEVNNKFLIEHFRSVFFVENFDRVVKWKIPIRAFVVGREEVVDIAHSILKEISEKSGVNIVITNKNVNSIFVLSDDLYRDILIGGDRFFGMLFESEEKVFDYFKKLALEEISENTKETITYGVYKKLNDELVFYSSITDMTVNHDDNIYSFLLPEIMKGLFHSQIRTANYNSGFLNAGSNVSLSDEDIKIIKLIYNDKIRIGMHENDAIKAVNNLLK